MLFKVTIDARCQNSTDKLFYLEKYTANGPKELVRSCYGGDDDVGYNRALSLLEKHYGNEYKIADCYLQKLNNWPVIKEEDGKTFEALAVFLTTCLNNIDELTSLNQLNSPKEMMSIVQKLPYKYREKWRNFAHNIIENGGRVLFKHLVKFVETQASIVNLPIFCDIKDKKPEKYTSSYPSKPKTLSSKIIPPNPKQNIYVDEVSSFTTLSNIGTDVGCICCKKEQPHSPYMHILYKEVA